MVTKRSFDEFCLARNNILCVSPSVWIACSNKLQSLKTPSNGLSTNPSVYHHLLNHAQCLGSVGLIKEQNCVDFLVLIFPSHVFRLPNFLFNVFVCGAAMHLVMEQNCQQPLVNIKKTDIKQLKDWVRANMTALLSLRSSSHRRLSKKVGKTGNRICMILSFCASGKSGNIGQQ